MRHFWLPLTLILISFKAVAQDTFNVFEASISEMQAAMAAGRVSSEQLVEQYLVRIEAYDKNGPALNSIVRINPEALLQARALDSERRATGPRSALHGIPILVKDNYNTVGLPTSGGSVALAGFHPNANATQIDKLIAAGAIVLAKTNLHEYAYGITTVGSLFGQTLNPYDIRRVPGGSSGGTGAAVAASLGAIGLGSDTCGSIRIPSSFNNLIGLRPTKGLSSIYGVMPLSHSQDVAGPLARSAEDLAIVLDVVSGFDNRDQATEIVRDQPPLNFVTNLDNVNLAELRIGKLAEFFENTSGAVSSRIDEALEWYESQGVEIVEVEIPDLDESVAASRLITQEFRDDLNSYLAEFGSDAIGSLQDVINDGLYHQAVGGALQRSAEFEAEGDDYQTRQEARVLFKEQVLSIMEVHGLDAIAYPTVSQLPVQVGDPQTGSHCSLSANTGLPALSMPVGFSASDLPIGLELLGKEFADAKLLAIANAYEQANSPRRAPSTTPALEDGQAPQAQVTALSFDQAGIQFEAVLEFNQVRNVVSYSLVVGPGSEAELYSVTLAIVEDEEKSGSIVHNLLPPQSLSVSGEYFMSSAFREAYESGRTQLRVFADSLPVGGASVQIP
ncbi:MAG: amidase [Pseudomonadales bacterium]|nr:amidase [Pseudomonadales bacterium]